MHESLAVDLALFEDLRALAQANAKEPFLHVVDVPLLQRLLVDNPVLVCARSKKKRRGREHRSKNANIYKDVKIKYTERM